MTPLHSRRPLVTLRCKRCFDYFIGKGIEATAPALAVVEYSTPPQDRPSVFSSEKPGKERWWIDPIDRMSALTSLRTENYGPETAEYMAALEPASIAAPDGPVLSREAALQSRIIRRGEEANPGGKGVRLFCRGKCRRGPIVLSQVDVHDGADKAWQAGQHSFYR
jgi:hypothetical protein